MEACIVRSCWDGRVWGRWGVGRGWWGGPGHGSDIGVVGKWEVLGRLWHWGWWAIGVVEGAPTESGTQRLYRGA